MGFLSGIFKKKKGGTFVGNLLRGASSAVTGGILGSGAGLAKWEAEQAQKEEEQYYAMLSKQKQMQPNQGYQVGQNIVNGVAVPAMANGGGNQPKVGESVLMESLKNKWYYVVGAVGAIFGGAYWISKRNNNQSKKVK